MSIILNNSYRKQAIEKIAKLLEGEAGRIVIGAQPMKLNRDAARTVAEWGVKKFGITHPQQVNNETAEAIVVEYAAYKLSR